MHSGVLLYLSNVELKVNAPDQQSCAWCSVGCYEAMSLLRDRPTHDGLFRPLSPAEAELAPFILRERDRRLGHLHTLCNAYCMAR